MIVQTEYEFKLPKGYVDANGTLHKEGVMRLATAADEILPQKDPRVEKNPSYAVIILLSRVIIRLGSLEQITPKVIEGLFVEDFKFLEDFYNEINGYNNNHIFVCPECKHEIDISGFNMGGL